MGASGVALAGCGMGRLVRPARTTVPAGDASTVGSPFAEPKALVSSNGELTLTLTAAAMSLPHGRSTRYALTYNGSTPGPTLRARPGDLLRITLQNDLEESTNLHFHGLGVTPAGNSDNPFIEVMPGTSFDYEIRIPKGHASGTFWYHPHHHGVVAPQVAGGLAGAIVIEDDIDDIPEISDSTERIIVLSDPKIGDTPTILEVTQAERRQGREGDAVLVNGALQPMIETTVGSMERWRIVNASASRYYELRLAGADMYLIATDQARFAAPINTDVLELTPGQRAEVLIPITSAGTSTLTTTSINRGMMSMMGGNDMAGMDHGSMHGQAGLGGTVAGLVTDVLTMKAEGSGSAPPLPASIRPDDPLTDDLVRRTREIAFGAMAMGDGEFTIDGKTFDHDRIDISTNLGAVEDWIITNKSMMMHPFHVHAWPFRVVRRSGGKADHGWRDTVNLAAGETVTLRIPMDKYMGKTVYHCHILDHEDLGMMGVLDVS